MKQPVEDSYRADIRMREDYPTSPLEDELFLDTRNAIWARPGDGRSDSVRTRQQSIILLFS